MSQGGITVMSKVWFPLQIVRHPRTKMRTKIINMRALPVLPTHSLVLVRYAVVCLWHYLLNSTWKETKVWTISPQGNKHYKYSTTPTALTDILALKGDDPGHRSQNLSVCATKCLPTSFSFKGLKDKNDTDDDNKESPTPSRLRKLLHSISFNDKMQQLTGGSPTTKKSTVIRLSYKTSCDDYEDSSEPGKSSVRFSLIPLSI